MADDPKKPKHDAVVIRDKNGLMRRENGTLLPGQRSNGKPREKGIEKRIRDLISDQTEGGWDGRALDGWDAMAMMMFDVAMGRKPPGEMEFGIKLKDRMEAVRWLYDRAHGKPMVRVESETTVTNGKMADLDVSVLDRDELDALEAHVEKIAAKLAGKATGRVLDVPTDAEILAPDPDPDKVP